MGVFILLMVLIWGPKSIVARNNNSNNNNLNKKIAEMKRRKERKKEIGYPINFISRVRMMKANAIN
jgi:hypothetical protein